MASGSQKNAKDVKSHFKPATGQTEVKKGSRESHLHKDSEHDTSWASTILGSSTLNSQVDGMANLRPNSKRRAQPVSIRLSLCPSIISRPWSPADTTRPRAYSPRYNYALEMAEASRTMANLTSRCKEIREERKEGFLSDTFASKLRYKQRFREAETDLISSNFCLKQKRSWRV